MIQEQIILEQKRVMPVVGVIFDGKKILLTKRYAPDTAYSHNKWQFVGGGIEFGEHPRETLHREVKEEIGIEIELLSTHPVIISHVFETANTHALVIAYPAKYLGGTIDFSNDDETSDAKWFRYDEIDFANSLPKTKEIIDETRKRFNIE